MTAPPIRSLLEPWPARDRVVVLQIGFGLGETFFGAWQHWRSDAQRCDRLDFVCIDPAPPGADRWSGLQHDAAHAAMAGELLAQWPPITPGLHRLAFDAARVQLLLVVGEAPAMLREIDAQVHVFLAGGLSTNDPADARHLAKALARLAAPGARLVSRGAAPHAVLRPAGFMPATAALRPAGPAPAAASPRPAGSLPDAPSGDPEHSVYAPAFVPRHRRFRAPASDRRQALIVGAGLAGCALACALAEQGWTSTLIDRHDTPAQEGSSNPAGLFHGTVNVHDGTHSRFNRAAALQARLAVRLAIGEHGARGSTEGLLRLEADGRGVQAMRSILERLRLDPAYVQALGAAEAGTLCGVPLEHPAWFYPGGGWVQPRALARSFLERAASACRFRGGVEVQSLQRRSNTWQLLDAAGGTIDACDTLVLANAFDARRLLGTHGWPMHRLRGQISLAPIAAAPWRLPQMPLAGAGYLLPALDGQAIFGASVEADDGGDAAPREADHRFNLQRLRHLSSLTLPGSIAPGSLDLAGRVGWRCVMPDRLPLIGAVPDEAACTDPAGRLRDLPRRPGLFVFSALGSRGIAWSGLGAQILAAQIARAPLPVEASLRDAIDPGRVVMRNLRRTA